MIKIRCLIGLHHYVACGWAKRMCIWCLRHEVNQYNNGKAEWTTLR